ncbi:MULTISPECIES: phage holin family protein [unclassified Frondihabitans]|jgi:Flp pilus assembly protein TadB|uniref:phage holin family protein n=1 Tax=unclassified Frondihabitans TaxID=2626248 RepID=UPI0006F39596|nr:MULTISPECIES: phage holin family protein [unclassified Frondihabitans]KQQ25525.1 hypothetical protein ASF54_14000 [Frondihabitans sp. Leaf304]RPE77717.1 putative superfamily III holin-X [Frondihabitans sp. PhB153]RPF07995.1 putative superfamily III holin-X [Frondihabitans sp. PhB161]
MTESTRADTIKHAKKNRSLLGLLSDIPTLVTDLVKGEIALLKKELIDKAKVFGIGAGLAVGALLFLFLMLLCLIGAGIAALSLVMPLWLAALLVAALFLVIAGILGFLAYKQIKKGLPPLPKQTIDSVKSDIKAVKGVGRIPRSDVGGRS